MGYQTDFTGTFTLNKPLTVAHLNYLKQFNETRRMRRSVAQLMDMPDPIRKAAGLPLGPEGAYFVGGSGPMGQDHDASITDYNYNDPPEGQPGLWCQWVPSEDGTAIEWDEGEKFYDYVEWLEYLINHFLHPWGYMLNGEVSWEGKESSDRGVITVKDNKVTTKSVDELLRSALTVDGAHHKQWYLRKIADMLDIDVSDIEAGEETAP